MSEPIRFPRVRTVLPAFALVLLCGAQTQSQQPTFTAKVEAVRVDVLVTDRGKPVTDLRRDDFEVLDNGARQQVDLVSFEQMPLNVVLALDASDSLRGERLQHLQAAGRGLLAALGKNDQAALITFQDKVRLGAPLTSDMSRVTHAIDEITPGGATVLFDATYAGMVLAESDLGRNLLIVFTDGLDTGSFLRREAVVDAAKRTEVVVYGAAVTARGRPSFLKDMSEQTGGSLVEIESTKDLSSAFLRILEEFRHRYLLSYSPRGVAKDGWHKIEVRVKGRRVDVKARRGYFAEKK